MQARAHLLQHDLSSKDLKTNKQTKVTYSLWISRVRIHTNQDKPSRGHVKSGTFKPCFVWIVLSEHKLHFYFLIPRVNKVNTCFEGRSRRSVWHHVIICLFYSIHVSLRTHGRDVSEGRMYKTHAEEEEGEEGSISKIRKWTILTSWIRISPSFLITSSYYTHGTRTQSKSIRLCLGLVDQWVHNCHQAWKCLFSFGVFFWGGEGYFLVAFLCSYETPTTRCKR